MKIIASFIPLYVGILLCSCKKESNNSNEPLIDVYLAGTVWETPTSMAVATYWKNGIPVSLTDGHQTAVAQAIAVAGTDVYVAGNEGVNAVYWKNGHPQVLAYGNIFFVPGEATSIALAGSDLYIAGTLIGVSPTYPANKLAVYWKNGAKVNLTPDSIRSEASSIAVSGNDVYVAGRERNNAVYWKNGDVVHLTYDTTVDAYATGLALSGNDVYVTGSINKMVSGVMTNTAVYWKNGDVTNLTDKGSATDIKISNGDVYISGSDAGHALYWKNGVTTPLEGIPPSTGFAINGLAISGNDVYVAGFLEYPPDKMVAKCWKNGSLFQTLDSNGVRQYWVKSIWLSR